MYRGQVFCDSVDSGRLCGLGPARPLVTGSPGRGAPLEGGARPTRPAPGRAPHGCGRGSAGSAGSEPSAPRPSSLACVQWCGGRSARETVACGQPWNGRERLCPRRSPLLPSGSGRSEQLPGRWADRTVCPCNCGSRSLPGPQGRPRPPLPRGWAVSALDPAAPTGCRAAG